jgi:hypothetical protein
VDEALKRSELSWVGSNQLFDVVQVPHDAVAPFGIVLVSSSVVVGSVLILGGGLVIAAWAGYRAGLRRGR